MRADLKPKQVPFGRLARNGHFEERRFRGRSGVDDSLRRAYCGLRSDRIVDFT